MIGYAFIPDLIWRPRMNALLLAAILSTGCATPNPQMSSPPTESDLASLVGGNTEFALDLFGMLRRDNPDGNLFFSPYSISTALGMTYAGAVGETAGQMAEVLRFDLPQERLSGTFALLEQRLGETYRSSLAESESEPLTLDVANAIWVERSFSLLPAFVRTVESDYSAEARNVDFASDPDGSRIAINDWVAERTRDRIRDLLAPGSIDSMTRLVLTNAIYFKGSWFSQFDSTGTRDEGFTRADGSVVQVPMMRQIDHFRCNVTQDLTAVELAYADGLSSMLILLPDGDLAELEQSLDASTIEDVFGSLQSARVDLSMPRFEFTSSFSLGDVLKEMGMPYAFSESGDFSGMTGRRDLFISAVIHKAFVKVDETGTEAAAATAVIMMTTSAAPEETPVRISIDRPFLFLIRDEVTGSILFIGRVADPSA
jgi:serpin B